MATHRSARTAIRRLPIGAIALGLLLLSAAPPPKASFRVIANAYHASVPDISADGSSVLVRTSGRDGYSSLSRWKAGRQTVISTRADLGGAISGDGSVVLLADPSHQLFRWRDGKLTEIGVLVHTSFEMSADASTIVGLSEDGAFMHRNGALNYLPVPDPERYSHASAVSADGAVIVGQANTSSGTEAVRWQKGVMQGLGDLAAGEPGSSARDVTPDGSIVVGLANGGPQGEAFRWENGVMRGLGRLGEYATVARAVSADGRVIVGAAVKELDETVATIWDPVHGMRNLKETLEHDYGLELSRFDLIWASGISSDGRTIVGRGRVIDATADPEYPEREIAWMVTISGSSALPRR